MRETCLCVVFLFGAAQQYVVAGFYFEGVKGPKKVFPDMPFGNMDSDKIEARKGLLETFLKVGTLKIRVFVG